ncbi:hypothetical protein [Branchiibius cervicis]|uniref:PqqD family protein n=1 Tax=Branchiibius cervicis TaxID=908252 RepID=A0ABW2ANP3_9MICO
MAVPALERVGLFDAMLTLIPQTSSLMALDRPLTALAQLINDLGGVQTLYYREIDETGSLIEQALHDRGVVTQFTSLTADGDPTDAPRDPGEEHLVQRAPFDDAVVADDEVLVLAGSTPLRLSALGATIWLAAAQPLSAGAAVEVCRAAHGDHPQAAELVDSALTELLEVGALAPIPRAAIAGPRPAVR